MGGADAAPPIMAVWVEKKVTLQYMGITALLVRRTEGQGAHDPQEIGARPGFRITPRGCVNPRHGAERAPIVDIVAALPQPATPAVLAELAAATSKAELAAKAGGKPGPAAEATAEFPARARRVEFRDSQVGPIEAGDCELLDQMREGVFAPLGAKVVVNRLHCVPHQVMVGSVDLTVEVLQPVAKQ